MPTTYKPQCAKSGFIFWGWDSIMREYRRSRVPLLNPIKLGTHQAGADTRLASRMGRCARPATRQANVTKNNKLLLEMQIGVGLVMDRKMVRASLQLITIRPAPSISGDAPAGAQRGASLAPAPGPDSLT